MPVIETCRLPVDGGDEVFCEITGHGAPLVLTHDAILHRETWGAQFEALSSSYRVVRWDRRGYGRSDQPRARPLRCNRGGITGARRPVLPGSGHLPHLEVPNEGNTAVLGFLT